MFVYYAKTVLIVIIVFEFITWCLIRVINTFKGGNIWLFIVFLLNNEPFSLSNWNKLILAPGHMANQTLEPMDWTNWVDVIRI